MAEIDASIPLQVRQPADPMETYGKAVSLKSLANQQRMQEAQYAKYEEDQVSERRLNDLYRGNIGADGQINRQGLLSGMASAGFGSRIPAEEKKFADADKAKADARHTGAQTSEVEWKVNKQKLDAANGAMASLLSRTKISHDDVIGAVNGLVNQGLLAPDQGAEMVRMLPGDQVRLREFLVSKAIETADASKRLDALMPKTQTVNLGGTSRVVDTNPLTNPNAVGTVLTHTQTPDSIASNATTRRGQNMGDARGRESNQIKAAEVRMGGKPPPGYRWVGEGRLEAIPGGPGDKLPEKQQNQVIGTQNLGNAIREYRSQLKDYGMLSNLSPDARAAMGTKYNNMMLQAKEAYNLGVLNGPDLDILTSVITDPRSGKGMITSNKALDSQASELDRIMRGIESTSANRRPQDARAAAPSAPTGPKKGAVQDGYVFLGGDPSNPKSWKKASK